MFERLAEELGCKYHASKGSGYAGGGGYTMHGDVNGGTHVVVGSSNTSGSVLRNIGVYTPEAYRRQQAVWEQQDHQYKNV